MEKAIIVMIVLFGLVLCAKTFGAEEPEKTMLVVQGVVPDTPAESAGLMPGDVFIEYNGRPVGSLADLYAAKETIEGDSVSIVFLRGDARMKIKLPAGQMGVYLHEVLPDIKFDDDAVIIQGIPKLGWASGKANSFFATVEAVANHMGVDKDYIYIFGVSGAAFRLHFHKEWCPSSPDPGVGFDNTTPALEAIGMVTDSYGEEGGDTSGRAEARKKIIENIDAGKPVIAIDLIGVPEWGIITGYQKDGEELICRTYYDRRMGYEIADKFPWGMVFVEEIAEPPADAENYEKSFSIALENLTTEEYQGYMSGIAAYDYWIEHLGSEDFGSKPDSTYIEMSHANAWIYERLAGDRMIAADYLDRIAEELPEIEDKLAEIAAIYREEMELLSPTQDVVVYSFNMKEREDWTEDMRTDQISRLKKAKEKELAALELWKEVNEALD